MFVQILLTALMVHNYRFLDFFRLCIVFVRVTLYYFGCMFVASSLNHFCCKFFGTNQDHVLATVTACSSTYCLILVDSILTASNDETLSTKTASF